MTKSIFASKTAWFNVVMGVIALAGQNFPALAFLNDPNVLIGITTIGNLILRFITKDPVAVVVPAK